MRKEVSKKPLTSKQSLYMAGRRAGMKALEAWIYTQKALAFWGY